MELNTSNEHNCQWREQVTLLNEANLELTAKVKCLEAEIAKIKRAQFGHSSEKMPSVEQELKKKDKNPSDPNQAQANRAARRAQRNASVPKVEKQYKVPQELRNCPNCDGKELSALGLGRETVTYEYIPPRYERHVQILCLCIAWKRDSKERVY